MELRLVNSGNLKAIPLKSATASDETATFDTNTTFSQGDQFQAVAIIGNEKRTYAPITASCPAPASSVSDPSQNSNKEQPVPSPAPAITQSPVLFEPKEGDTVIQGFAKSFDSVELCVSDGSNTIIIVDAPVDKTSGQFTYKLSAPLATGETIKATGISQSQPAPANSADQKKTQSTSQKVSPAPRVGGATLVNASLNTVAVAPAGKSSPPPVAASIAVVAPRPVNVVPADLETGHVRGYFTLGLVLAQSSNDFSANNASPYIDFNLDNTWLNREFSKKNFGLRINSFFDARLTAIATSAVASSSNSSPAAAVPQTISASSVLLSRQAASMQIGTYIPVVMSRYTYGGRHYSMFVAPIGKAGFYTPTDTNGATNSTNTATATSTTPSRFFDFFGSGFRIGHTEDYPEHGLAPELLNYLDITYGKYGNFEYANNDCLTGGTGCFNQRLWRYAFEGMIKIPHTPLVFGMSANVAAQRSHVKGEIAPQDDLRFLFGAKFDAQKIVKSLFTFGS